MDSIKIYKLDSKGRGIGRFNGKPIFIFNALIGEEVLVKDINERSKYVTANVEKILVKSFERVEPKCPYFGICGGCDLMHMKYSDQLAFKRDKVLNTIHSLVDSDINVLEIKYDDSLYYRNKAEFKVNQKLGFIRKNSHDIVSIEKCYLVDDRINEIVDFLNTKDLSFIDSVLIRVGIDSMVVFKSSSFIELSFIEELKKIVGTAVLEYSNKSIVLFGNGHILEELGSFKYKVSPNSFFQVNTKVAEILYSTVLNYIKPNDGVLDLYCGTGSIGIFLSNKASSIYGVELNENAIEDAFYNKKLNNLSNVEFKCLDTSLFKDDLSNIDVVVVDPPRSGLNSKTINYLLEQNVNKIVYVSCDLMTLTRDLNLFKNKYDILEVTPVDMFPNTYHVESVVLLESR